MDRRTELQSALDSEVKRWSEMPTEQLIAELVDVNAYEVEADSKRYQFEVQILENKSEYIHVSVAVDDGRLPFSIMPLSQSFIQKKV
jgi:hypothetical protein